MTRMEGCFTRECQGLLQPAVCCLTPALSQDFAVQAAIDKTKQNKKGKVKGRFKVVLLQILV